MKCKHLLYRSDSNVEKLIQDWLDDAKPDEVCAIGIGDGKIVIIYKGGQPPM